MASFILTIVGWGPGGIFPSSLSKDRERKSLKTTFNCRKHNS